MSSEADFLKWLDRAEKKIAGFEASAGEYSRKGDSAAYAEVLREKAEFLADLHEDARPFLAALPPEAGAFAERRLGEFSASAERGIELGSIWYMSALLYPDEHVPGEPNNFELFAGIVRGMLVP